MTITMSGGGHEIPSAGSWALSPPPLIDSILHFHSPKSLSLKPPKTTMQRTLKTKEIQSSLGLAQL